MEEKSPFIIINDAISQPCESEMVQRDLLSTLFRRQFDVILHSNVDHVPGRPHEAAARAGQGRH